MLREAIDLSAFRTRHKQEYEREQDELTAYALDEVSLFCNNFLDTIDSLHKELVTIKARVDYVATSKSEIDVLVENYHGLSQIFTESYITKFVDPGVNDAPLQANNQDTYSVINLGARRREKKGEPEVITSFKEDLKNLRAFINNISGIAGDFVEKVNLRLHKNFLQKNQSSINRLMERLNKILNDENIRPDIKIKFDPIVEIITRPSVQG